MAAAENAVVKGVMETLSLLGVPHFRNNVGIARVTGEGGRPRPMFFGAKGWPDVVGVLPDGRFLGVEAKRPDYRDGKGRVRRSELSDSQERVRDRLLGHKALYLTVRSGQEMCQDLKGEGYFTDLL